MTLRRGAGRSRIAPTLRNESLPILRPSGPRPARFPQDVPQITRLMESASAMCWIIPRAGCCAMCARSPRRASWHGTFPPVRGDPARRMGVCAPCGTRREGSRATSPSPAALRKSAAWLISNVAVHPEFRRRGIARGLIRHALDMIRAEGGRKVYLQVDVVN